MSRDSQAVRESLGRLLALPLSRGDLLILTHDNPDPDCIASAAALSLLLSEKRRISIIVAYSGVIGRAENRAMVELLDLPLRQVSELDFADFAYLALVDAQPGTGNTAVPDGRLVDIVIDHHPLREATRESPFYEVRSGVGATATILTQYLRSARVKIPRDLATALVYGIRSETQDLGREVSHADLEAYEYLLPRADCSKLSAIATPRLSRRYYQQLHEALGSLEVRGKVAFSRMESVSDPDFVPEVADLIVRMEGVEWALATGQVGQRLYLSIRTSEDRAAAGDVMQMILDGIGRGGGHGMRAGGNIDLGTSRRSRAELERLIRDRFLQRTAAASAGVKLQENNHDV